MRVTPVWVTAEDTRLVVVALRVSATLHVLLVLSMLSFTEKYFASPIGRGLLGASEGEEVTIDLPMGERRYTLVALSTLPQQMESDKE